MVIEQYDIILVNLDPTMGSEIRKTRPCVIISPDVMNRNLNTIVIAPMTTKSRKYPTRIPVTLTGTKGYIIIDQIRTIDKKRAIKNMGHLNSRTIRGVKDLIRECYVD